MTVIHLRESQQHRRRVSSGGERKNAWSSVVQIGVDILHRRRWTFGTNIPNVQNGQG